tara:strand:+ start:250 stop:588 length:339 start_codon:yes stop_codon:yes gene_type:complete
MSKYVMVECSSTFQMKYAIEIPDDEDSAIEYAKKMVESENTKDFTQKHLGENITYAQLMTFDEVATEFRNDEPYFADWEDAAIKKAAITPIGFDREVYYEEEERKWRLNINS